MTYQVEFWIRVPQFPKEFQWDYRYIPAQSHKEAIRKAVCLLRSLRRKILRQIKEGKREPEHMLALALSRITPMLGNGRARQPIYLRRRKFGDHIGWEAQRGSLC